MNEKIITRKDLYDLVWSKPMTELAKEFSYSDNGLRKICIKHNIPMPKVGYWSKLKFGKKVLKTKLVKSENVNIKLYIDKTKEENTFHPVSLRNQVKKEIENSKELNFIVPNKLSKPDILILEAQSDLKNKKPTNWGNNNNMLETSKDVLNIVVSKSNITRAILFMDSLIKLLKRRGHTIKVSKITEVIINEESIEIRFREVVKRKIVKGSYGEHSESVPSGILSFRINDIYPEKQWRDSDTIPLESRLPDILTYLEVRAHIKKEERIKREVQMKMWEDERKKENELKLLKEKEIVKSNQLFKTFSRWQKSQDLRNYLRVFESHALSTDSMTQEKKDWIAWAYDKAGWIDPIISKEDAILGLYKE